MNTANLTLTRGIFGALFVGALGFGATQAFASPVQAAAASQEWCTAYEQEECQAYCEYIGASQGRCYYYGFRYCECIYS